MIALVVAGFSFGSAGILVRFAGPVNSIQLAFFRLFIAWLIVLASTAWRGSIRRIPTFAQIGQLALSGVILALHFSVFIFSLQATTVASASFLVNTVPIFVVILAGLLLRERPNRIELVSVILGSAGIVVVLGSSASGVPSMIGMGELGALAGAFLMAAYTLVGRKMRTAGISASTYVVFVYGIAALTAFVIMNAADFNPVNLGGLQTAEILAIIALGLVPTVLGHGLYNYALGLARALPSSMFIMLEPVIASVLAFVLFAEMPTIPQIAGYGLITLGVLFGGRSITGSRK
jgi:drug/metabolite transporter (DMT)-like permease